MLILAIAILGLICLRVDIKLTMLISLLVTGMIRLMLQHNAMTMLLKLMAFGYHLDNPSPLQAILRGAGLLSFPP